MNTSFTLYHHHRHHYHHHHRHYDHHHHYKNRVSVLWGQKRRLKKLFTRSGHFAKTMVLLGISDYAKTGLALGGVAVDDNDDDDDDKRMLIANAPFLLYHLVGYCVSSYCWFFFYLLLNNLPFWPQIFKKFSWFDSRISSRPSLNSLLYLFFRLVIMLS